MSFYVDRREKDILRIGKQLVYSVGNAIDLIFN
jgi:hypothetical protein